MITGHRRENFGKGFIEICNAIKQLATKFPNIFFVYPIHLNPKVRKLANDLLAKLDNIFMMEPLEYEPLYIFIKAFSFSAHR